MFTKCVLFYVVLRKWIDDKYYVSDIELRQIRRTIDLLIVKCLFVFFVLLLARQPPPPVGHALLIHEVSRSHATTHRSRYDSSGRVISPSQRPLPDNTQHSQQTSMPRVGFEPKISAGERPQTHALDRAATGPAIIKWPKWDKFCALLDTVIFSWWWALGCPKHVEKRHKWIYLNRIMHRVRLFVRVREIFKNIGTFNYVNIVWLHYTLYIYISLR